MCMYGPVIVAPEKFHQEPDDMIYYTILLYYTACTTCLIKAKQIGSASAKTEILCYTLIVAPFQI